MTEISLNNKQGAGYYDIIKNLFQYFDYDTLHNGSQVCVLWRRVGKDVLQQFLAEPNIKVTFRIKKVRFLLPHNLIHNGILHITLYQKINKNILFSLKPVYRDTKFTVYESDQDPPTWILSRFNWSTVWYQQIGQTGPNDLCQQKFQVGKSYKGHLEQSVIGSGKLATDRLVCCCPIQIMSLTK